MNWDKLRSNIGWHMRLHPAVAHLDEDGDLCPQREEDWVILSATDDHLVISSTSGFQYRLGKDHIKNFTSDPERSLGATQYGLLTLLVQLYTQGNRMWHVTTPMPGIAVPPAIDMAARARDHFMPELERVFRSLVYTLDRAIANFGETSMGRGPCPGDTWKRVLPATPTVYPASPAFRDLSGRDARMLAEFYGAVEDVFHTLTAWVSEQPLNDVNAWNVLAHKAEHALRLGTAVVERFSPGRPYDPTMPAAGTMIARANRALETANRFRQAHIARYSQRK